MDILKPTASIGTRIIVGFASVLALMIGLTALGLSYVADSNQRLRDIAHNGNIKTGLATAMHSALRERAFSLHTLPMLTDSADRDIALQRFEYYGAAYLRARTELESLPLTARESEVIGRIRALAEEVYPKCHSIIAQALLPGDHAGLLDVIRKQIVPSQQAMTEQVGELLVLQRSQTAEAMREAQDAYIQTRDLLLFMGGIVILLGLILARQLGRRATAHAGALTEQAMRDSLTGLFNRHSLHLQLAQRTDRTSGEPAPFAVVLLDLDRFKAVNDTLGHQVGDEVLREVGRRLRDAVHTSDVVARLGGDEYVLLLRNLEEKDVPALARRVLDALEAPFPWEDRHIDIGASLGIALYPSQCSEAGELLRCADIAMYAAKREKTGYALYSPEQARACAEDLSLKGELRHAILSGQLTLQYQPQIDHRQHRVTGLEALVRWDHPLRGYLSPDQFLPLAEEAGVIDAITHWVLQASIVQLARLHKKGHFLSVAVNLSAHNLSDRALPSRVGAMLAEHGVSAEWLTLEVTESAVIANLSNGAEVLADLAQMGITLSIDDFGTGYSSLAYLRRLPLDELKIDKSFVLEMSDNESDAVIVRSTIDLAHKLGMKVVAEGVETEADWLALSALGCNKSQGFYMSPPLAPAELEAWLMASAWAVPHKEMAVGGQ